jgi:hypothetical protein
MGKRLGHAIVAIAAAALLACGGATTLTASGSQQTTASERAAHTIRMKSVRTGFHYPYAGRTPYWTAADVLRHKGRVIGYDSVSGRFSLTGTGRGPFQAALALRGGILLLDCRQTDAGDFTGRVTGGTGRFKGATGTVTGTQVAHNVDRVVVTYRI